MNYEYGYSWVPTRVGCALPLNTVICGHESDGSLIYVGRAKHEYDVIPAKIISHSRMAYVSFGGSEFAKDRYEILCGTGFNWISSYNGNVPPNAIEGGKTSSNEVLYIGRVKYEGGLTLGKVHQSHNCLYFPYYGVEHRANSYEVLVQEPDVSWTCSSYPVDTFEFGRDF